jgi:hypothetical protein
VKPFDTLKHTVTFMIIVPSWTPASNQEALVYMVFRVVQLVAVCAVLTHSLDAKYRTLTHSMCALVYMCKCTLCCVSGVDVVCELVYECCVCGGAVSVCS